MDLYDNPALGDLQLKIGSEQNKITLFISVMNICQKGAGHRLEASAGEV